MDLWAIYLFGEQAPCIIFCKMIKSFAKIDGLRAQKINQENKKNKKSSHPKFRS